MKIVKHGHYTYTKKNKSYSKATNLKKAEYYGFK